MHLKSGLDALTMEAAVLGGAVLGCGGGGKLEDGLYLGEQAINQNAAGINQLASLPEPALVAAIMPVHSSGTDTQTIRPYQAHRAIQMLQDALGMEVQALMNGGLGAVDSIIGWELGGFLGVPLLNCGIAATHHPVSLRNLIAHWQELAPQDSFILSLVGRNGTGQEHLLEGYPAELQRLLCQVPLSEKESYVAAAGPLPPRNSQEGMQLSQISHTLQVGQVMLSVNELDGEATVAALQELFSWQFSTFATVTGMRWHGQSRSAYGQIDLRDVDNRHLQLIYSHRYRELRVNGQPAAAFPDLISTLGIRGTPITGEEVFMGQDLYVMTVPYREQE